MGERIIFPINDARTIGHPYGKQVNVNPGLTPDTKLNEKWIIDLNGEAKTIK